MNAVKRILTLTLTLSTSAIYASDYSGNDVKGIESVLASAVSDNSKWRKEAEQRIEQHRKSEVEIRVVDQMGNAVPNAKLTFSQTSHQFKFGGVITGGAFSGKYKGIDPELYKHNALNMFNKLGFANSLKYKHKKRKSQYVQPVLDWAKAHDIPVRGHTLAWPGWQYMHKQAIKYRDQENWQALRNFSHQQVREYAAKWDVTDWDLFNETRDNKDLQNIFGQDILLDWYHTAQKAMKNEGTGLLLNENRVISALPGTGKQHLQWYKDEVDYLLENGVKLTALGFQSRFKFDVHPSLIIKRLNEFVPYGLPIYATEFEIRPYNEFKVDELKRAEKTEQIMTAYFSHPSVEMIMAWTFYDRTGPWGLVDSDGHLKLNGKIWQHLTKQRWHSSGKQSTDRRGKSVIRGYKGRYQATLQVGGKRQNVEFTIGDENSVIDVIIP